MTEISDKRLAWTDAPALAGAPRRARMGLRLHVVVGMLLLFDAAAAAPVAIPRGIQWGEVPRWLGLGWQKSTRIGEGVAVLGARQEADSGQRQFAESPGRNEPQIAEPRERKMPPRWQWTVLGGSFVAVAGAVFLLFRLRKSNQLILAANIDLQRSRTDLQNQTDVLQSVLDHMGEGVVVSDERGQLLLVNPAAEKILGVGLIDDRPHDWPERVGIFCADRTTPFPVEELPLVKAIGGQSCDQSEVFVRNSAIPEGRWLSVTARPLCDKAGARRGAVAVFSDVSDRKKAEEDIRALNATLEHRVEERTAQVEAANRELEAFSYSVSHDLRAPLRSIDGFSRIMLEDYSGKLDPDGIENLATIRSACQRMGQLIDDMLRLSKVTRAELHRTAVDLSGIAETVAAELNSAPTVRKVEFVAEPNLMADADANLMRIVFQNLLGNAWKFTSKQPTPRAEFGRVETPVGPAYVIRDNGVGFDPAYEHKLFTAFQRLHAAADFPGSGIGLATVQRIIHRHGGRVWAQSSPGRGASFFFTLPSPAQ